jgi:hypothetical protein
VIAKSTRRAAWRRAGIAQRRVSMVKSRIIMKQYLIRNLCVNNRELAKRYSSAKRCQNAHRPKHVVALAGRAI